MSAPELRHEREQEGAARSDQVGISAVDAVTNTDVFGVGRRTGNRRLHLRAWWKDHQRASAEVFTGHCGNRLHVADVSAMRTKTTGMKRPRGDGEGGVKSAADRTCGLANCIELDLVLDHCGDVTDEHAGKRIERRPMIPSEQNRDQADGEDVTAVDAGLHPVPWRVQGPDR